MAVQIEKDIWDAMNDGRLTLAQGAEVRELRKQRKAELRKATNAVKAKAKADGEAAAILGKIEKLMGVKNEDAPAPAAGE